MLVEESQTRNFCASDLILRDRVGVTFFGVKLVVLKLVVLFHGEPYSLFNQSVLLDRLSSDNRGPLHLQKMALIFQVLNF